MSSKKMNTRERILVATRKLMEVNRGNGVTMLDIAKAAGISRQALYLHFETRAELLIAATRHHDQVLESNKRYDSVVNAESGVDQLDLLIEFWGNYVPDIYGLAKALMISKEVDEAAAAAWQDRMDNVMGLCKSAVERLKTEKMLSDDWSEKDASEFLWTLLSITNWERLTVKCGWSVEKYVLSMQLLVRRAFVKSGD
jgi:AcrR family transcriptional regulator